MCAIGAEEEVEADFDFGGAWRLAVGGGILCGLRREFVLEPGFLDFEIGACELVVEIECYIW